MAEALRGLFEHAARAQRIAMAKSENKSPEQNVALPSRGLLRVIATDVHFWIPLAVLFAGLVLLNKLR